MLAKKCWGILSTGSSQSSLRANADTERPVLLKGPNAVLLSVEESFGETDHKQAHDRLTLLGGVVLKVRD